MTFVLTPKHKGRAECNQNASTLKNFFQQVKSRDEDDLQVSVIKIFIFCCFFLTLDLELASELVLLY